jgi:uncharacterized membrane protein
MASPVVNLASGLASTIVTFGAIIVGAGVVAFVAARTWGAHSKLRRQAIFGVVGFMGLVIALVVAQARLRGVG